MPVSSKSFRGFRVNRPLFKVQINKDSRTSQCKAKTKFKKAKLDKCQPENSGRLEERHVKTFVAILRPIKIPLPPNILLEKIEQEKRKVYSETSPEIGSLWDSPIAWDNEDLLFSIASDVLGNIYKKPARETASNKPLNSFMAFRAYNSQFGYGLKQNILSSLLASAWHSHPEQQGIWDTFAQQFNFVKPKCGFVEWVDQRYERES